MSISFIIVVHVDDLLISSARDDMIRLGEILPQFKKGPIYDLLKEKELEYLRVQIQINARGHIGIHQNRYINSLQPVVIGDVIRNNQWKIRTDKWKTLIKRLVG